MFKTLISLRFSSSLKTREPSLDCKDVWLVASILPSFRVFTAQQKVIEDICFRLDISYKCVYYKKKWN